LSNEPIISYFVPLSKYSALFLFWVANFSLTFSFRKNLKALFIVHPTTGIKILWSLFKPFIRPPYTKQQHGHKAWLLQEKIFRRLKMFDR
uniref:CRAL-TRIO domain-containing protein n=1 Tax=Echinostoma caproni TaxID=27848 RepID=A0A183AUR2_9TREM